MDILLNIVGGLILLFILWAVYVVVEAHHYHGRIASDLQRELGFREGTIYNRSSRWTESAVAIVEVADGGVFCRAGFRAGNLLPSYSHTGLFKLLHRHRGQEAELAVADGGDGPSFYKRPLRVVRFVVPAHGEQT
jgi:hypothetical protein